MHDIPEYVTLLGEEHATTSPYHLLTEDQGITCLAFDMDCIMDCCVGGLRFIGV